MILCGLLCWMGVSAHADVAPAVQPFRVVLPDGVRLILKPEAEADRVAVSVFIRVGADASPDSAAIGEMVARTLFYGNANRTQNSIQALAGEVGGSLDVLRTGELVALNYVTVPAQLPEALHLLCDCLKNAAFAPESLQRALQAIHEERATGPSETNFKRGYAAVRLMLGEAEPEESQLRRVTQAQAQAYFQRHYAPAQTVISLAGRFDMPRVQGLLTAFTADYNRRGAFFVAADPPQPLNDNPQPFYISVSGSSDTMFVGTPAPSSASADYPAFTVLQALLGGGHASRLFRQSRETLGLGYEVGALYAPEQSLTLVAYLQWNTQRDGGAKKDATWETARRLLNAQLDGISANPPTDEELARARNFAIGQDALRHERCRDRAFLLGWYEAVGKGYTYDTELPRRLADVTRADILRTAKTYLGVRANIHLQPSK